MHSLYNLYGDGVEHPDKPFFRGCWEAGGTSLDRGDDADCIIVSLALNHDLDGTFYNITDSMWIFVIRYITYISAYYYIVFVIMLTILTIILPWIA